MKNELVPTFTVHRVSLHKKKFVNDGLLLVFEIINFAFSVNLQIEFSMAFNILNFRQNWAKSSYSRMHFSERRFFLGLLATLHVRGT
jgi:hypothetical protein